MGQPRFAVKDSSHKSGARPTILNPSALAALEAGHELKQAAEMLVDYARRHFDRDDDLATGLVNLVGRSIAGFDEAEERAYRDHEAAEDSAQPRKLKAVRQ